MVLCLFIHHLSYVMYVISAKEEIKSIYLYIYRSILHVQIDLSHIGLSILHIQIDLSYTYR